MKMSRCPWAVTGPRVVDRKRLAIDCLVLDIQTEIDRRSFPGLRCP